MNFLLYRLFRVFPKIKEIYYIAWNRLYLSMLGIEYGRNLRVNNKINVRGVGKVIIGDDFRFTSGGCINPICRNIQGCLYLGSKDAIIKIGDRVGISSACLWANDNITIGNDVNIGGDTLIFDNDAHSIDYMQRRRNYKEMDGVEKKVNSMPVIIGDDVWIGARCLILKGVHIGARSIIGAGSVVTKDIPTDSIAAGNPCKVIRKIGK